MSSPAPHSPPPSDRRSFYLWGGAIFLAALLTYSRCLSYGLVSIDDPGYVSENSHVMNGLSWNGIHWAFTEFYRSNWHPLTWLSLQTDASLFRENFGGFHFTNILLHAANSLLVLLVFWRLTKQLARSGFAALLFAVHPQHVESVAWVTERKDVLSLFFGLLAILAYSAYVGHKGFWRYLVVILFLVLSLLSKSMLVTLPCVLLLLDWWPLSRFGRESNWRLVLEKVPLFALSAASSIVTMLAQRSGLAIKPESLYPLSERLGNGILSLLWYVEQTFWPFHLTALYPHTHARLTEPRVLLAATVLLLLTGCAVACRKRIPAILVGWLWFLGTLVPVLGFVVQQGWQGMADRYVYWPHIGLFLAIVWGISDVIQKVSIPVRLFQLAGAAICVLCALLSFQQCASWSDGRALSLKALQARSPNPLGHVSLGIVLANDGDLETARQQFQKAVDQDPTLPPALNRLAGALCELGRTSEAMRHYEQLGRLLPKGIGWRLDFGRACLQTRQVDKAIACYQSVLEQEPNLPAAQLGLGNALHQAGNFREAQPVLVRAVEIMPESAEAHFWLGRNALWLHNIDESIKSLRNACRLQPGFIAAADLLAQILLMQKEPQQAAGVIEEALRKQPNSVVLLSTSALIQSHLGHQAEASELYARATKLDHRWPSGASPGLELGDESQRGAAVSQSRSAFCKKLAEAFPHRYLGYDAIAAAQAALGDFKSAVSSARTAVELSRDNPRANVEVKERLILYERGEAVIDYH